MHRLYRWCLVAFSLLCLNIFLLWYRQISIVIVPHHSITKNERNTTLAAVARSRIVTNTVFILSTDHFSPNQHMISTDHSGQTICPNIANNTHLVYSDHGITNLYDDVQRLFPHSNLTPVIIGNKVSRSQLQQVAQCLQTQCRHNCLLVGSVDFSHYLPQPIAQTHDRTTIKYLNNLDQTNILSTETDSKEVLSLVIWHAQATDAYQWHTYGQTNSGSNSAYGETTGHVYGWYRKGIKNQTDTTVTYTSIYTPNGTRPTTFDARLSYGSDQLSIATGSGYILTGWNDHRWTVPIPNLK